MILRDVMTNGIHTIQADASLQKAALDMASLDIGVIPVEDENRLVGIITDRDIAVRAIAQGADPSKSTVRSAMTAGVACASGDTELSDAMRLMEQKQIRRLLVTDRDGNPEGIVSLGDIAVRCEDKAASGEVLQRVSRPEGAS